MAVLFSNNYVASLSQSMPGTFVWAAPEVLMAGVRARPRSRPARLRPFAGTLPLTPCPARPWTLCTLTLHPVQAITTKADIFSMGIVLWEIAAGARPWPAHALPYPMPAQRRGWRCTGSAGCPARCS